MTNTTATDSPYFEAVTSKTFTDAMLATSNRAALAKTRFAITSMWTQAETEAFDLLFAEWVSGRDDAWLNCYICAITKGILDLSTPAAEVLARAVGFPSATPYLLSEDMLRTRFETREAEAELARARRALSDAEARVMRANTAGLAALEAVSRASIR